MITNSYVLGGLATRGYQQHATTGGVQRGIWLSHVAWRAVEGSQVRVTRASSPSDAANTLDLDLGRIPRHGT